MPFPYMGRGRSTSMSRKYKKKTTIWDNGGEFDSSDDEHIIYVPRGRTRSRTRFVYPHSRSGSRTVVNNLGDSYHGIGSSPSLVYLEPEFGWPDYTYLGHHRRDHACPRPTDNASDACKEQKDRISELEQKIKDQDKEKNDKRIRDLEKTLKKLNKRPSRVSFVEPSRSILDIDLELAGCNSQIACMRTMEYRCGGRSHSRSHSRSRSRSSSCCSSRGEQFQQQQQYQRFG